MAIDPKLVSIKTSGELPVSDPTDNANFLFYEGETLQRSPMSNIYDKVSSGLLPATTTTVPEATGFHRYLVHTAGTYTNFSGIVVTAADLDVVNGVANNEVVLEVNNGVSTKRVRRLKGDSTAANPVFNPANNTEASTMKATSDFVDKHVSSIIAGPFTQGGINTVGLDSTSGTQFRIKTGFLEAKYISSISVNAGYRFFVIEYNANKVFVQFHTQNTFPNVVNGFFRISIGQNTDIAITPESPHGFQMKYTPLAIPKGGVAGEVFTPTGWSKDFATGADVKALDSKVFSVPSKNLYDYTKAIQGQRINGDTGLLETYAGAIISPIIPVTPGATYIRSNNSWSTPNIRFLDAAGTPLRPIINGVEDTDFRVVATSPVTAPATATGVQFIVKYDTSGANWQNAQFELGAVATSYVPFGGKIDANNITNLPTASGALTEMTVAASDASPSVIMASNYVCSGAGDQVQINAAIDALFALGGGQVYLPKGNYNINGEIRVKNNVQLVGSGWATRIKLQNGVNFGTTENAAYLVRNDIDNIGYQIRDMYLDGNRANNPTGQYSCVGFVTALNCKASNLFLRGAQGAASGCGIVLSSGSISTVESCYSTDNARHGIATTKNIQGFLITGNYAYGNVQEGIHTSTGVGVVDGNYCYSNTNGIDGTNAVDSVFSNNVCYNNRHAGIAILNGYKVITGNTIRDNTFDGIRANYTGTGIKELIISGNLIKGNAMNGISGTGFNLVTITDNIITDVPLGFNGINITDKNLEGPIFIRGNQITGGTKSISLTSGYTKLQIVDNYAPNGIEYDPAATGAIVRDNMA